MPFLDNLRTGIIETANSLGMQPEDLATIMSYETGGTFNPMKNGPTTQYGQHKGLIQFGGPQRAQFGVDLSSNEAALSSQLGPDGAVAQYFRAHGWQPGMSGLDAYSVVNAGRPGRYNASDAGNGGAPGTVADKWQDQMAGHRAKAQSLLGGEPMGLPQNGFDSAAPMVDSSKLQAPDSQSANAAPVRDVKATPSKPTPEGILSALGSALVSQANAGELPQAPALNAVAQQASQQNVNTSDPLGKTAMPSLLDRLLQGDIGGFRDNVQGFEQSAGAQTEGVPVSADAAPAEDAGSSLDPIMAMLRGSTADFRQNAQGFEQGLGKQPQGPGPAPVAPPQASPAGDNQPAGLTAAQQALLKNYPSPQQRAATLAQSQPPQAGGGRLTMHDIMPQSFAALSPLGDGSNPMPQAPNNRTGVLSDEFSRNPAPAAAPQPAGPIDTRRGVGSPEFSPNPAAPAQIDTRRGIGSPEFSPNEMTTASIQQGPAPMQGPNFPALPQTGPTPAAKPAAKKAFDTMGFLTALGSVAAALSGTGSPEVKPVSLSGVSHRPDGFNGLPMPKGLL